MKLEVEVKKTVDDGGDVVYCVSVNRSDADFAFSSKSADNVGDAFEGALLNLFLEEAE